MATEVKERSVPKPVFTDAEAGAKEFPSWQSRSYNYFTPRKRRATVYEDVTVDVQPDPARHLTQGWVYEFANGVYGDYLAGTSNPLAIEMSLRYAGQPIDVRDAAQSLAAAGARSPCSRIIVLVHGLCMNDLRWRRNGHDHGAALAEDLDCSVLYLRYNSGLHVSENGRLFSDRKIRGAGAYNQNSATTGWDLSLLETDDPCGLVEDDMRDHRANRFEGAGLSSCDEQRLPSCDDALGDGGDLFGSLARTENDFGKALPPFPVGVDTREAEVFEGGSAQRCDNAADGFGDRFQGN